MQIYMQKTHTVFLYKMRINSQTKHRIPSKERFRSEIRFLLSIIDLKSAECIEVKPC